MSRFLELDFLFMRLLQRRWWCYIRESKVMLQGLGVRYVNYLIEDTSKTEVGEDESRKCVLHSLVPSV